MRLAVPRTESPGPATMMTSSTSTAATGADPYQGHWGDENFFPQPSGYISVGSATMFTAATAGKFWLGINDDAVSMAIDDNSGALLADVTVSTTGTLPTTWGAVKSLHT